MNYIFLYIAVSAWALAAVLGTVAHTFRTYPRKPADDPAWFIGMVGAGFFIAAIVSIWV